MHKVSNNEGEMESTCIVLIVLLHLALNLLLIARSQKSIMPQSGLHCLTDHKEDQRETQEKQTKPLQ